MFEIVPVEYFQFSDIYKILPIIAKALNNSGYIHTTLNQNKYIFKVKDKKALKILSKSLNDIEYDWLVTDFFEILEILPSGNNLLFALASNKDSKEKSPLGREAWYITTEVGGMIFPPCIPRIIIANALINLGYYELGENINCSSSFPLETALSGDITFMGNQIDFNSFNNNPHLTVRPVSFLSYNLLTSQSILDLLEDEYALSKVELAKALPIRLVNNDNVGNKIFSLFNHYSIKAKEENEYRKEDVLNELLNILLDISIHLNWNSLGESSQREFALKYAIMQRERLKNIEQKERNLKDSLNLLQKRYPNKIELIEWEINNIYSHVVRYSPIYLAWKTYLESYIYKRNQISSMIDILSYLDWEVLHKNDLIAYEEINKIIKLLDIEPAAALNRIRVIIEKMISIVYEYYFSDDKYEKNSLAKKIYKLNEKGIFPSIIYIYLNTLRLTGNVGSHQVIETKTDVIVVLPIFIRVVEWFVDFIKNKLQRDL